MSHRHYPSIDRARHQIDRHDDETPPLPDGVPQPPTLFGRRIAISDEAREAMGSRLAEFGASLRHEFLVPEDMREAMRRTMPVKVSLQPLADALSERPVSSEEKTA